MSLQCLNAISNISICVLILLFVRSFLPLIDLRGPHPRDPPDVTATREKEEAIIKEWIDAYVQQDMQQHGVSGVQPEDAQRAEL